MSQQARDQLGRFGIWRGERQITPDLAARIEELGFGALWLGSASGDLAAAEEFLAATTTLIVATGIVNMWQYDPHQVAASFQRVEQRFPGRFLLGVGAGHPEVTQQYARPYDTLARYVDTLLDDGVPAGLILAALGPKVLRLAAERTAGAHPYLVTPGTTPGRPGRSSARARSWPRSRRWSSARTQGRRGRSAAPGWRSRIWAWPTTPPTCAAWAGRTRT